MNNIKSVRGFTRVSALALVAAAGMTIMLMAPVMAADSVTVKRSADPQVTYRRLQQASAEVCRPVPSYDLARFRIWKLCYERTLESTVANLQEPVLLAIHRQHVGSGSTHAG